MMNRKSTRVAALQHADENALAAPSTRTRRPSAAVSKPVTIKTAAVRATSKRTALGDLSNKTTVASSAKLNKTTGKPVSKTLANRRRSGSNPVVEQAKIEAVVQVAKKSVASKATASVRKPLVATEEEAIAIYWDDLDKVDLSDPLMVAEYVVEIFEYMRELELQTMPDANYMVGQKTLDWDMRTVIVDWMVEVHNKFQLLPETLFLAVNVFDRFLSHRLVVMEKMQLVAMTSIFIASKYEEVNHPSLRSLVDLVEVPFTEMEIRKSEIYVLQFPNPMNFLRRISKAENYDIHSRTLTKYLMEVTLLDESFLHFTPSKLAAAGTYLARKMLGRTLWSDNIKYYSGGFELAEIKAASDQIEAFVNKPTKHQTIFKKYASKKFMKASTFVQDWLAKTYAEEVVSEASVESAQVESEDF